MQNYRAGPVGPVGAHGVPRGAGGRISEEREDEGGGATRGPGSTSTHLNFGPSQGQCGRTTRSPLSPLRHLLRFLFFLFARPICLFLSFSHPLGPPFLSLNGPRTALSRHTVLGPTPSPVCRLTFLSFSFFAQTNLRSCEIPISGDTRVIGRRRIVSRVIIGHVIIRTAGCIAKSV